MLPFINCTTFHSVRFQYSLPVQNSKDLKSVIASFIALLVRDLGMRRSFGNKSLFLCKHPFTIHLSQDWSRWKSHIKTWQPLKYYKQKQCKLSSKQINYQKLKKKNDFKVNGIVSCETTIMRHETKYIKLRYFSCQRVLNSCRKLIFSNYFYLFWVLLVTQL